MATSSSTSSANAPSCLKLTPEQYKAQTKRVALITGITGQDGSYLTEFLLSHPTCKIERKKKKKKKKKKNRNNAKKRRPVHCARHHSSIVIVQYWTYRSFISRCAREFSTSFGKLDFV
jgi:hypothetical protein